MLILTGNAGFHGLPSLVSSLIVNCQLQMLSYLSLVIEACADAVEKMKEIAKLKAKEKKKILESEAVSDVHMPSTSFSLAATFKRNLLKPKEPTESSNVGYVLGTELVLQVAGHFLSYVWSLSRESSSLVHRLLPKQAEQFWSHVS